MHVDRPVWRRFLPRFTDRAAKWVRSGGAAAIQHSEDHIDLVLGVTARGQISEQALWAVLALNQRRYVRIKEGPAAGLFKAKTATHAIDAVLDWCDRDSMHEGPTRPLDLDCLECGACCCDAHVLLDQDDLDRFRAGGRADLTKSAYIKRSDGKVTLRFLPNGLCQHLQNDNKCRIYELRPFNCRVFPVGSEACLAARESTLGIRDDALHKSKNHRTPQMFAKNFTNAANKPS